jgi:hypothetical protein
VQNCRNLFKSARMPWQTCSNLGIKRIFWLGTL